MDIRYINRDELPQVLELLNYLADTSELDIIKAKQIFIYIYEACGDIFCATDDNEKIIGVGTLCIESKLIHNGGTVAHIEDVVVHPDYRGRQVGKELVNEMVKHAKEVGAYKIILNCSPHNIPFYEKCGFSNNGVVQMRKDLQ